jgi:hypothetical protein
VFERCSLNVAAAVVITAAGLSGCAGGTSEVVSDGPKAGSGHATQTGSAASNRRSKADLDAYVSAAQRSMRPMLPANFKKIFSSIRVKPVYPDGIEYAYVYRAPVDASQTARYLDTQLPLLKAVFRTQIAPEMKRYGWANPSATWTYSNPDGALVWTHKAP